MAQGEIIGWITIHGQHIPLMKGESKAKAVARFIKGKRNKTRKELNKKMQEAIKPEYRKDKNAKEIVKNSVNYEMKRKNPDIKGYSTDPDNKVGKANKAANETYKKFDKYVQDANNEYIQKHFSPSDELRRQRYREEETIRNKYPNADKNKVQYAKMQGELKQLYNNRERAKEDAKLSIRYAEQNRDEITLMHYQRELNKPSSRYKLKAKTTKKK